MSTTAFKQVKNGAKTITVSNALNNTTSPLTFSVQAGTGSKFPQPGNSFYITAYNSALYSDPNDDPNQRIGLCTVRSTDSLTVTWGQLGTAINAITGTPDIKLLLVDQSLIDIHTAVNALETATGISGTNLVSPTLVTPSLGVATATSLNKVTVTAPATGSTLTIPDGVVLTGPAVSGTAMTLGNAETVTGAKTFNDAKLLLAGLTSGSTTLKSGAVAGSSVLTLPVATDTLVGRATTDTLTNKTLTTPTIDQFNSASGLGAAWTAWTPTITAGTGTFTTVSGAGRWMQIGKTVHLQVTITCTTVGTAAASVIFTLPATANGTNLYYMGGREDAITGNQLEVLVGRPASTNATVFYYNNTFPGGSGSILRIGGTYEAA